MKNLQQEKNCPRNMINLNLRKPFKKMICSFSEIKTTNQQKKQKYINEQSPALSDNNEIENLPKKIEKPQNERKPR